MIVRTRASVASRAGRRTHGTGSLVLVLLLALVASTTSATADDGTNHLLEKAVLGQFFGKPEEPHLDLATTANFPVCANVTSTSTDPNVKPVTARTCTGEVKSWDGLELDARVTFPNKPGPLPLVVLLHGWGGNRNGMHDTDPDNPMAPARFWSKGYATLVYTARGFGASCGALDPAADVNAAGGTDVPSDDACLDGHTHLAERGYEVRDTQHLIGLLVDADVADPQRLAVTGGSYGGGQSWLLATAMPWVTPKEGTTIQLAAAAPFHGWTDLYGSSAPNGRATDGVDQSRSHEEPFGVVKLRYVNETYAAGRDPTPAVPNPNDRPTVDRATPISIARYNTTDPEELHSFFDGWMAVFNAGEPHDSDMAKDLPGAFRGKSAYYPVADPQNDYLTQLAARRVRPVPIFAVQGWTDFVFPAVEALQMYRKLKATHPGYPISMLLGDTGHGSQNPLHQQRHAWRQAGSFIDAHLGVATDGVPAVASSFATLCPAREDQAPLTGDNWDALVKKKPLTFASGALDLPRATDSSSSNIEEEAAADPSSAAGRCIERPAHKSASGASWEWSVGEGFTMLGLPSVTLPYRIEGSDATVVAKLWDVGTDGTKVLVTRGVYRLSAPGQPASSGSLTFQLFGNHWRFEKDHFLELEIGQLDRPFLRPDNVQSSIVYDGVELTVPQAKA
jgi:dienelactone hydrolase